MAYITEDNDNETDPPTTLDRNWFVGAYLTRELKLALQKEARTQKRTVSQQLILILEERYTKEIN